MFNRKYIFKVSIFQPAICHISILVGFLARVDTDQKIKNHWVSNDSLFDLSSWSYQSTYQNVSFVVPHARSWGHQGIRHSCVFFSTCQASWKKGVTWCVMNSSWHHSCCLFLLPTWRSQNSPEHSSPNLNESCSEAWFWEKRYSWLELAGWIMEICWTLFEDCQQTPRSDEIIPLSHPTAGFRFPRIPAITI